MKFVGGCFAALGILVALVVGFVILCVVVGASSHTSGRELGSARDANQSDNQTLLLTGWKVESQTYGGYKVVGTVVNKTGRDMSYAEIDFRALDSSGAQVDTLMTNTTNLPAGGKWRFEAGGFKTEQAARFELAELKGW
jgi:hypothetical protein